MTDVFQLEKIKVFVFSLQQNASISQRIQLQSSACCGEAAAGQEGTRASPRSTSCSGCFLIPIDFTYKASCRAFALHEICLQRSPSLFSSAFLGDTAGFQKPVLQVSLYHLL